MTKEEHDWQCIDVGLYDSLYECSKCGKTHMESIDNVDTYLDRQDRYCE